MSSMYADRIHAYDSNDMYSVLCDFPGQIRTGLDIGNTVPLTGLDTRAIRAMLVCGMGGSGIGGDVLRMVVADKARCPIVVNRDYQLPAWVDAHTLVVVMSYSGGTEESLAAFDAARDRGAACVVVTSGGALLDRAEAQGVPAAIIPGGLAPRCALGYLFAPLLMIAARCDLFDIQESALRALVSDLDRLAKRFADYTDDENPAITIAEALHDHLPVFYGAQYPLEAVLQRWRCQIEENAKNLAWSNVLPEMNHNEIVGWERQPDLLQRICVVVLHDRDELPQLRTRLDVTLDIIRPLAGNVLEVYAEEEELLSRILGLIYLGDWVSFYLAVGTGVDPFPIANINRLKDALARR